MIVNRFVHKGYKLSHTRLRKDKRPAAIKSQVMYALFLVLIMLTACNGQVKPIVEKENKNTVSGQAKMPRPKGSIKDLNLLTGIEDSDGTLWFGSNGEGLYKYD